MDCLKKVSSGVCARKQHFYCPLVTLHRCRVEKAAMLAEEDGVDVEFGTRHLLVSKIVNDKLFPLFSSHVVDVKDAEVEGCTHLSSPLHAGDAGVDEGSFVAKLRHFSPLLQCDVARGKASLGSVSQLMGGHFSDWLLTTAADQLIQLVKAAVVNCSPYRTCFEKM